MTKRSKGCVACGADWPSTARFCGRCGRSLEEHASTDGSSSHPGAADSSRPPLTVRRSLVAVGALIGLAIIVVAVGGPTFGSGPAAPEGNLDVELPDARDRSGEMEDAPARPTPTLTGGLPPFACEPEGCAGWEARIGDGDYAVAEDVILQASSTAIRAIDPSTGRTWWRITYDEDGLPSVLDRPRVQSLDDLMVVTTAGGLLQVRSAETGTLRWHVDLEVDQILDVALHGEVLVVSGWPMRDRQHPPVRVAGFDRGDGELRWDHQVHRAVTLDADPLVVQPRNGLLRSLDPRTGEQGWSRTVTGPVRGLVGDDLLALVTATGIEIVDPASGEVRRSVPRAVSNAGLTRLVGGLLLVDAPSGPDPLGKPRSDMTVVPLTDDASAPLRFPDTTGIHALADGLIIITQGAEERVLRRLDEEGRQVWSVTRPARDQACCWTVRASRTDGEVYLVPSRLDRDPVEVVDLTDGSTRSSFPVATEQVRNLVTWTEGIGVEERPRGTLVSGPGGRVVATADARLLTTDPQPVLVVEGGLLGLDPGFLVGTAR